MRNFFVYLTLFIQTFLKRHKKQVLFSILTGFLSTLLILQLFPVITNFLTRKHLKTGVVGNYSYNNLPPFIQQKISIGLTSLTQDGTATPSAAQNWTVVNNLIYTFHLKPNLKWHDGKQLTTDDINFKIKGAEIRNLDNYTLQIELKEPYAPLPVLLSRPLIRDNHLGLGLYKVNSVNFDYKENRIREITLHPMNDRESSETYKFYHNRSEAILALKMGEIDILSDMEDIGELSNWHNLRIKDMDRYDKVITIFYNLKDARFKEKEVRQALAYAIPPFEGMKKAISPISPLSWAYSQKLRLYRYDTETAGKILSKSQLVQEKSELTLSVPSNLLNKAQIISDAWKNLGIKTKIKVEDTIPDKFQVTLRILPIPPDPDQYNFWQSTQEETNITGYSNAKIDKLLEDGRKTFAVNERKKIYADFQFYLVDDAPAIFLYYPKVYTVERI